MQTENLQNQIIYQEDEIDLIDLIKVLWKRKYIILLSMFVFIVIGIGFALTRQPVYKSELTFTEESTSDSASSGLSSLASSLPLGLGSGLNSNGNNSLMVILQSRTFREELIKKLNLYDYFLEVNKIKLDEIENEKMKPTIHDVARWLNGFVNITKDEKTNVYRVEVQLKDKEMTVKIANEYFKVLDNYLKNEKLDRSKISKKYLKEQVESIEKQISEQQNNLRKLEEKYNTVSITDEAKVVTERVVKLKQEIIENESELKILKVFSGEKSLEVRRKEETIHVMKDQLSTIMNGKDNLPVDIIPLKDIPKIKFKLQKLEQELEVNVEVYKMLRLQYEQKKLNELNEKSLISILDSAIEPKHPFKPNRKLIVIISFVLGTFLGIFLAFLLEFLKNVDWEKITE